ncbi:L-lactate permease [Fusibacter bizertensis]
MMLSALSFAPIIALLVFLLGFKFSATKAGAIALVSAVIIAVFKFGMSMKGLVVATEKGLSLALYVLVIIWSAMLLYQLVSEFKAIETITHTITHLISEPFVQFLILSWVFSATLQGIAGFGVPVIIVVPILISLGFDPLKSAVAVLLGHSWAVSFGSMGSSFYTITLVTGLDQQQVGYAMAIFNIVAMIMMGFFVCYIYDGISGIKKGIAYVMPTSVVMSATMYLALYLNLLSMVSLLAALSGLFTFYVVYLLKAKPLRTTGVQSTQMNLKVALLPYAVILCLTLVFQMLPFKHVALSFKFPETQTALGFVANAEAAFAKIKLFGHPGPILLLASGTAIAAYDKVGILSRSKMEKVVRQTINKCIPTSKSLSLLIITALVMMDSGMTQKMALTVTVLTGSFYVFFAPFIGVLGSFITGSNTNSNVLFGKFQYNIAGVLGVNPYLICGLQSISGSIGIALGPTVLLMSATASGLSGRENDLYRRVLPPILITAMVMGIIHGIIQLIFY